MFKKLSFVELLLIAMAVVICWLMFFAPNGPEETLPTHIPKAPISLKVDEKVKFQLRGVPLPVKPGASFVFLIPHPLQNGPNPDGVGTYHVNFLDSLGNSYFYNVSSGYYQVLVLVQEAICVSSDWLLIGQTKYTEISYHIDTLCPKKPEEFL